MKAQRLSTVAAIAVAVGLLLFSFAACPTVAGAASRSFQCQHPVTTGVEVSELHDVSSATACKVALNLYRYGTSDHEIADCTASNQPYWTIRSFEGWRTVLTRASGFGLRRGRALFFLGGTDFPAPC